MRSLTFALAFALLALPAAADSLLTVRTHVDAFEILGKKEAARDGEIRIWVGENGARRDDGTSSAVLRADRRKLYLIDHEDKTYSALDLPVDLARLTPAPQRPLLDQLIAATRVNVALAETAETRKLGSYDARRFNVSVSGPNGKIFDSTIWVSSGVPGFEAANRVAASLALLQPGSADWAGKLERLPGFPVLQETILELEGTKVKSKEELVSAETKNPPAGSYEIPQGYQLIPYDPFGG
jgi:hypothetical protein